MMLPMFEKIRSFLGSDEANSMFDRSKEEHLVKQREAQNKLEGLRERRRKLEQQLDEKRELYERAKANDNESRAEDLLQDAERIKDDLETVLGRINEVSQRRNLASNLVNVHEMREGHGDTYWQELKELDDQTLIREFSRREMEVEEMVESLDQSGTLATDLVETFRDKTENLHRDSELRKEWEDTSETQEEDPESVFEPPSISDDEMESIDMGLSDDEIELS